MSKRIAVTVAVVCALAFGMAGCGEYEPESSDSMNYYMYSEPSSLYNPNRIAVQKTKLEKITFPEYLFGDEDTSSIKISDETVLEFSGSDGMSVYVRGKNPGLARVILVLDGIESASVIVVVTEKDFYTHPGMPMGKTDNSVEWWGSNKPDDLKRDNDEIVTLGSYITEPTFQLAWKYRNPSESYGFESSGKPCGIDMLAYVVDRDDISKRGWVRTTYDFGGWHYDLNGVTDKMTNGIQENENVKLELKPEFVYDKGVPYLQITHMLTNKTDEPLEGQKFGASADITYFDNAKAPLTYERYGALLSDGTTGYNETPATFKFRLVCLGLESITEVSTLWLGEYGNERNHIYDNQRSDITNNKDTALCFSYKDIELEPGESKKFVIRLTQVQ